MTKKLLISFRTEDWKLHIDLTRGNCLVICTIVLGNMARQCTDIGGTIAGVISIFSQAHDR